MKQTKALRCRHAFETACVHANGEVVCSIIDGRGDFVSGNVHEQHLREIFNGAALPSVFIDAVSFDHRPGGDPVAVFHRGIGVDLDPRRGSGSRRKRARLRRNRRCPE
ncbi:MAG: SPASM domain-containing protein [Acidobacteriota bacterium]